MKKSNLLLLAFAALGLGFTAVTTATTETAHAAYYYWTKTKNYSPSVAMKQKNPGTTAYMWNAHHTARLHNLKNYPRTTWYLSKSVKMTRGSKSAIYYRVTSGSGKVNGYVWRGYLTTGANTNNDVISSPNSSEQVIANQNEIILSLFPNTKESKTLNTYLTDNHQWNSFDDSVRKDGKVIAPYTVLNNPLVRSLQKGEITYKQYIQQNLEKQNINPNNYSGWSIGVSSSSSTDYYAETGGLGTFGIVLMPASYNLD